MFIKYIREYTGIKGRKGRPFGVVVALSKTKLGWSLCHKKDRWNKKLGLRIAIQRAETIGVSKFKIKLGFGHPFYHGEALKKYPRLKLVEEAVLDVEQKIKDYNFNKEQ